MNATSQKQETETLAGPEGRVVVVAKNFHIYADERLPLLDSPNAQAYRARDRRSPDRPMFALLCSRLFAPRLEVLRAMARVEGPPVMKPNAWEVVTWPLDERQHFLIVFDQPGGPRLFDGPDDRRPPMREDELYRTVLKPLVVLLRDMKARVMPHRAIRADNIFYRSEARDEIIVGECVSEPAAMSQPLLYEPAPNAMAMPMGRGGGTLADDLYNVGVLLLVLLNGGDPYADVSAEDLLDAKIEHGSYATLISKAKVPLSLMEPLRGLLTDDPSDRWTVDDLDSWMNGRTQSPKPPPRPPKMPRPFLFMEQEYLQIRVLAQALARNWTEAREAVAGETLVNWLSRGYAGNAAGDAFLRQVQGISQAAGRGRDPADHMLGNLLVLLDPSAPIRYRSLAIVPDALGQALSVGINDKQFLEDFIGIFRAKLPTAWLQNYPITRPEFVPVKRSIELIEQCLLDPGWGLGVERCLYELNKGYPCQSPLLDRFLVYQVNQLLPALEALAEEGPPQEPPVDRHIAAFCATNITPTPKRALDDLAESPESDRGRMGMLRLLAAVQEESAGRPFPHVARWLLRNLSPAIEAYHHRPYRAQLGEKLQGLAEKGQLRPMLSLIDNQEFKRRDTHGFERARALYARSRHEINWLRDGGMMNSEHLNRGSRQAAVLVSSAISGLTLLCFTLSSVL